MSRALTRCKLKRHVCGTLAPPPLKESIYRGFLLTCVSYHSFLFLAWCMPLVTATSCAQYTPPRACPGPPPHAHADPCPQHAMCCTTLAVQRLCNAPTHGLCIVNTLCGIEFSTASCLSPLVVGEHVLLGLSARCDSDKMLKVVFLVFCVAAIAVAQQPTSKAWPENGWCALEAVGLCGSGSVFTLPQDDSWACRESVPGIG